MNKQLENYARDRLMAGLSKCTEGQQEIFKLMYGRKPDHRGVATRNIEDTKAMPVDGVVKEVPADSLDWAMQQVARTLKTDEL